MVIALITIYGGLLSLWHGGNLPPKTPKLIKNIAWGALPAYGMHLLTNNWWLVALSVLGDMLKTLGHGQYFSLGKVLKYIKPERLDFLVTPFFGKDPRTVPGYPTSFHPQYSEDELYWRCVLGLFWCGGFAVLGSTLALMFVNPLAALTVFVGAGMSKAFGYMIGWAVSDHNKKPEPTYIGEVLTGLGTYATLAIVYNYLGVI